MAKRVVACEGGGEIGPCPGCRWPRYYYCCRRQLAWTWLGRSTTPLAAAYMQVCCASLVQYVRSVRVSVLDAAQFTALDDTLFWERGHAPNCPADSLMLGLMWLHVLYRNLPDNWNVVWGRLNQSIRRCCCC